MRRIWSGDGPVRRATSSRTGGRDTSDNFLGWRISSILWRLGSGKKGRVTAYGHCTVGYGKYEDDELGWVMEGRKVMGEGERGSVH